jgi:uncharacterized RDD family membrane protein YckC
VTHGYPPPPGQPQYGQQPPYAPYGQQPQHGYGVPGGVPGYAPGGVPGYAPGGYGAVQPVGPGGQPLADQVTRLLARLIDGLIVGGVSMIIAIPLIVFAVIASADSIETTADGTVTNSGAPIAIVLLAELALFVLLIVGQYLYEVEFAKRTGQTIGKRVMKIRIVAIDPHQPVNRAVLAKRWLVIVPGGLIPVLSLINVLWCLWDQPYRQCLHDKFADTVVVKVPG